jgi:hypothetical protein
LWEAAEKFGRNSMDMGNLILELRARVEALEAALRVATGSLSPADQTALGVVPVADAQAAMHSYKIGKAEPIQEWGKGHTLVNPEATVVKAPSAPAGSQLKRRPLNCPSPATIAECGGPCEQGFPFCDCGLLEKLNPELRGPARAPAGSLVERVAQVVFFANSEMDAHDAARAAILAVAAWLRENDAECQMGGDADATANLLEDEVNNG